MSHITFIKKNKKFWINKKVLITGHTGFKGSWLIIIMNFLGAKVFGLSFKPKKNSLFKIAKLEKFVDSHFCDLKNYSSVKKKIEHIKPDYIFHFAAQSLVSIAHQKPKDTLINNYETTLNILDIFYKIKSIQSILITTTDKVYQEQKGTIYKETDFLRGSEAYSVSKVTSEHVIDFYKGLLRNKNDNRKILTARSGNVIGGGDWSIDRIIPDIINAWYRKKTLKVRNPNFDRPWMHVLDTLFGYILFIMKKQTPNKEVSTLNFGPKKKFKKFTVINVVEIAKSFFEDFNYKIVNKNEFYEVKNLFLDSALAKKHLNFEQKWNTDKSIELSLEWYRNYQLGKDAMELCIKDIKLYLL